MSLGFFKHFICTTHSGGFCVPDKLFPSSMGNTPTSDAEDETTNRTSKCATRRQYAAKLSKSLADEASYVKNIEYE
jgi:hypothetical protein